ncbi:MAG: hypothetical protein A2X86_13970 [Bdellovibrionales bacterium GWA2_49_15]|nr:MAG: hypothetical protein A2X86_13970 [Bdellovibrionales bacterium GWA2_49_15]HAZ13635.1 hypothetical protein [Bdellovibrionales bacterium]
MKHVILLLFSFVFLTLGTALAKGPKAEGLLANGYGGIDFTYSSPECFFTEPEILKLSTVWEILNCYTWEDGFPINQCRNLEFYVVSNTSSGEVAFTSFLEGTQCLTDPCTTFVRLPLTTVLTTLEYDKYQMGLVVIKDLRMHLAFGGEEDQFGQIVGRKLANAYYDLKLILNGTGTGSIAIIGMSRELTL